MNGALLPDEATMSAAFLRHDPAFDGIFFTAVRTTGIFCKPTCRARKPRLRNVSFYATAQEALLAGYRPCKLCRPIDPPGKPPSWVQGLLSAVDADPSRSWRDRDLRRMNVNPVQARRWFKSNYGMTFHAYSRARRLGQALGQIKDGSSVIQAAYGQGYDSLSGFNDAFRKLVGASPTAVSPSTVIVLKRLATPLGLMLAAASHEALYLLEFMDRRSLQTSLLTLRRRAVATLLPGESPLHADLETQLDRYFQGQLSQFTLPLAPQGTLFQQEVWTALGDIPAGETRSYRELAEAIDRPGSVRAVARANGANPLAIVIPRRRVIGSDGHLTGYGGGLWRKRRLLELEGAPLQTALQPA
ncbi:MAG: methylated-DNA--[protein]-cysteine S-methyltransferase [Candidatus Neomarinimicrobiota bacterium]